MKMMRRTSYLMLMTFLLFVLSIPVATPASAATITVSGPGETLWSSLSVQPTDTVLVNNGATLRIDVANAVAGTVLLGDATGEGTLLFNSGSMVTINNSLDIGDLVSFAGGNIDFTVGGTLKIGGALNF